MSVKGQGFGRLHSLDEALEILITNIHPLTKVETVKTDQAITRKLAEEVYSPVNLPGFNRSAMDGYAVKAQDIIGASITNPVKLLLSGSVDIGDIETPILQSGQAIQISTGAPLPDGSDTVVKLEDCEIHELFIEVVISLPPGKNVAHSDEDVKKDQLVLEKETKLEPWDVAILESMGISNVRVFQKPKIVTYSTGDELQKSGSSLKRGQIVDSNRPALNAWITQLGGDIFESKCLPDDPEVIKKEFEEVILTHKPDLIVTTGGTSVGRKDYLPEIIMDLGELWVHGIAIRPGKPVALGKLVIENHQTPIIALPGYPLAAFLNFHNFVSPVLEQWTKSKSLWHEKDRKILAGKIPSKSGYVDFVRLKEMGDEVDLIRITGAGILSSLVKADYLLIIPEDIEGYNKGDEVEVIKVRSL